MSERLPSRNEILGFAERTRQNLEIVEAAHLDGDPRAHLVTQAVLSLLGIVVFPYEQYFKEQHLDVRLKELENLGWPSWEQTGPMATTLTHLLRRVRNATAHSQIEFSSDSGDPSQVTVTFWSEVDGRGEWEGAISAERLLRFSRRFLRYVEDYVG